MNFKKYSTQEINPYNDEATFLQSDKIFENHLNLVMLVFVWTALTEYSQYPCARVSVTFQVFCIISFLAKLAA